MRAQKLAEKGVKRPSGVRDPERPVIEAALIDEVVENGFRQATVAGICRRAAVDGEAFNRHFADLEEAYCLVLEGLLAEVFGRIMASFDGHQRWPDQARAGAHVIFEYLEEDRRRGRFMMVEVLFAGERAQLLRESGMKILTDMIDGARARLPETETLSRSTAEAIAGSMFHQVRAAIECDDPVPEDFVPQLMYSVVQPYFGTEEARRELAIAQRPAA